MGDKGVAGAAEWVMSAVRPVLTALLDAPELDAAAVVGLVCANAVGPLFAGLIAGPLVGLPEVSRPDLGPRSCNISSDTGGGAVWDDVDVDGMTEGWDVEEAGAPPALPRLVICFLHLATGIRASMSSLSISLIAQISAISGASLVSPAASPN